MEAVSPLHSRSHVSQSKNPITEIKNSLPGSHTSLNYQMETQEASGNAPSTARKDPSRTP